MDPRCKGMPLSSFILKPMQRVTRYPLIIKNVSVPPFRGREGSSLPAPGPRRPAGLRPPVRGWNRARTGVGASALFVPERAAVYPERANNTRPSAEPPSGLDLERWE